jgi:hypothetical protein
MMVARHLGGQSGQRRIVKLKANIAHLRQVSQLKISDFSGEMFKGFKVL